MSYTNLKYHIVFSTKDRQPLLAADLKPRLIQYMGGIARELGGKLLEANGPADHIHLAASIHPQTAVADFVRKVKSNSSRWIHETFTELEAFAWQEGYAAFSVSQSSLPRVAEYIRGQEAHHRKMTFQEELIALLEKHGIEYDERYVFA